MRYYVMLMFCCCFSILPAAEEQPSTPFTEVLKSEYPAQEHFVAEFFNVVAVMAMVIIVMLIIAWFLKKMLTSRMVQGNATSRIKIEERRMLGPKSQVYLLEVDGLNLIIGEIPAGLVRLGGIPLGRKPFSTLLDKTEKS